MLKDSPAFSGFSVDSIAAAQEFYGNVLGIDVTNGPMGLELKLGSGHTVFIYEKPDHVAASYTILNFPVPDIDAAVDELVSKGVEFIQYPDMTDDKGIARGIAANMGPDIAWFKDPAGNFLSVLNDGR